jgi:hypothetical protein
MDASEKKKKQMDSLGYPREAAAVDRRELRVMWDAMTRIGVQRGRHGQADSETNTITNPEHFSRGIKLNEP